jgi:hypothetical protein
MAQSLMEPSPSRRLEFQNVLESIIGEEGAVYYQPPPNAQMTYPCLVYEEDSNAHKGAADNGAYMWMPRYQVTFIHHLPDSDVKAKLVQLPWSSFSRHFTTSGLNHDVYAIYY